MNKRSIACYAALFLSSVICSAFSLINFSSGGKLFVSRQLQLSAGFGGRTTSIETNTLGKNAAATIDSSNCPCGSTKAHEDCCKPSLSALYASSPEELIRARYCAYASDNVDYIIATTSTKSSDYLAFIETPIAPQNGLKRWAKSIRSTMINEYFYTRHEIDAVDSSGESIVVTWRHLAIRKSDNVMYPIKETSFLEKIDGKYFYVKGEVIRPSPEESSSMTSTWPDLVGLVLKPIDDTSTIKTTAGGRRQQLGGGSAAMPMPQRDIPSGMKRAAAGGTSNTKKGTKKV
jgi:uncharacterized protein YchJ